MSLLSLERVTKRFDGLIAVDGVSFDVDRGQVVGFLGPNGAGKSTTMRMITQIFEPDEGAIRFDGVPIAEAGREAKRRIGFLPENNPLYGEMLVAEYLDFMARLRELGGPGAGPRDRRGRGVHRDRAGIQPADRRTVQGLQAARGTGGGHSAPPRSADSRRAHRGARPEPARGDPASHRAPGARTHGHAVHTRAARSAAHLLAAPDHQSRQAGGRRLGGVAGDAGDGRGAGGGGSGRRRRGGRGSGSWRACATWTCRAPRTAVCGPASPRREIAICGR